MHYFLEETLAGVDKQRIDLFLKENYLVELSRSKIQWAVKKGFIKVNGEAVKVNYQLREDDMFSYEFEIEEKNSLAPADLPVEIIYEDDYIVAVNKPRGIVVHPAESVKDPTIVNFLIYKNIPLANVSEVRPGVVHRLDRFTSGVLIFVKTFEAYDKFVQMFKEKKLVKKYIALCYNNFKTPKGIINMPIGRNTKDRKKMSVKPSGKEAITYYEEFHRFDKYSLVELDIKTGRTHQIRVHLSQVGHPVVGDDVYGPKDNEFGLTGQFLHARSLEFKHPFTGEDMKFEVRLPEELEKILKELKYEI